MRNFFIFFVSPILLVLLNVGFVNASEEGGFSSLRSVLDSFSKTGLLDGYIGLPGDFERKVAVPKKFEAEDLARVLKAANFELVTLPNGRCIIKAFGVDDLIKDQSNLATLLSDVSLENQSISQIGEYLSSKKKVSIVLASQNRRHQGQLLSFDFKQCSLQELLDRISAQLGEKVYWVVTLLDLGYQDKSGRKVYVLNVEY